MLDPFSGGGSIPLEALRLGCEAHAVEYNPVANLILKCTLEFPQKYGKKKKVKEKDTFGLEIEKDTIPLLEDVKKWGKWVLNEAKKEIGNFYPQDKDGFVPVGYIWARTIPCQNPTCNAKIPLMRQFWLAKKKNKKVALYPYTEDGEVKFKIVGDGYEKMPDGFDPSKGTVSRAIATCPVCGYTVEANTTRKLFQKKKASQRLIAVVLHKQGRSGKTYRLATEKDTEIFKKAEEYLKEKREKLMQEWGIDPVPDEEVLNKCHEVDRLPMYGMKKWGDIFNSRQKLALITFTEKVRLAYEKMIKEGVEEDYAKAVVGYLGLFLSRFTSYHCVLVPWQPGYEKVQRAFSRQALGMTWDYTEINPMSDNVGNWQGLFSDIQDTLSHLTQIPSSPIPKITQSSATELPYPDNFFDAVFTDPPYYDNVNYSVLSDFFYVWLKRSVGDFFPELFMTLLVPKTKEIVADPIRHRNKKEAAVFFESMLKKAFKEIARVLKPQGIVTIVYTHKSTSGWETLINSLLDSGLVPTASWPIDTEMKSRLLAKGNAALASSIYFVCRKMERKETGWLNDVKDEIKTHIHDKLKNLWEEGVSGADYFISAIGSAIEIFGKYEKVMDFEGNEIGADKLLEYVREIVTDYAVKQILHNGISAELSSLTRFYLLFRWAYKDAKVPFDDARKLAQSSGVDLESEWNKGFIKKDKDIIAVLSPLNRTLDELKDSNEMIDVLHEMLLLWKAGRRDTIIEELTKTGYGEKESFYKVAQAISETLPKDNQEKRLLDGFLSEKERIKNNIKKIPKQGRLFP